MKYPTSLPQIDNGPYLHYVGMETDLIFNHGMALPGFASFPLLETVDGRKILQSYYDDLIWMAQSTGVGVILDSVTWVANRDRGVAIGYTAQQLEELNLAAVEFIAEIRAQSKYDPILLCAQLGPRDDGYAPSDQMSAEEAEAYHFEQMKTFSQTQADFVGGFTICYPEEAIGIIRAGKQFEIPVVISFTVETDGRLPTGTLLSEAVLAVDEATDSGAAYFLVNCAHPDHIREGFVDGPWIERLRGIVANASRCSHAELDEATQLDDGNPEELGLLSGNLSKRYPHFTIFGGCCGTDMRHMHQIATQVKATN